MPKERNYKRLEGVVCKGRGQSKASWYGEHFMLKASPSPTIKRRRCTLSLLLNASSTRRDAPTRRWWRAATLKSLDHASRGVQAIQRAKIRLVERKGGSTGGVGHDGRRYLQLGSGRRNVFPFAPVRNRDARDTKPSDIQLWTRWDAVLPLGERSTAHASRNFVEGRRELPRRPPRPRPSIRRFI